MFLLSLVCCSGPGAADAIARAELLGWVLTGTSLALVVPALAFNGHDSHRRRWWLLIAVAAHPGWWMSGRGGDCGRVLTASAIAATVLTAALVCVTAFRTWRGG